MSPLSSQLLSEFHRRTLLDIARRAITETVVHGRDWCPDVLPGALNERRGAFVTLELRGRLRGCIGQPAASETLAAAVAHCAVAAAMKDPRFAPVKSSELPGLHIEISVVSLLVHIDPAQIEIGRHGIQITNGAFRALLLPRVPVEHRWTAARFLEESCAIAGLPPDAWKSPETIVQGFTAEVFSDSDPADSVAPTQPSSPTSFT